MRKAKLAALTTSCLGLGCMGMSQAYGAPEDRDEKESTATIHRALDLGCNMLDTASFYGMGTNEELLGRAIRGRRADAVLATKWGLRAGLPADYWTNVAVRARANAIDGSVDNARVSLDGSLRRLRVDVIDLWYLGRVDREVPIEESIGAMGEAVAAGKVRHIGLCEASAGTIRRAHATHPITAVQSEWSLWTRDVETTIMPTCRELGIGFVAFSPLGRGFLTGQIRSAEELRPDDMRRTIPRFQSGNFERNHTLVTNLQTLAKSIGCTAAQLALAWLLAQGRDVVAIPGTKRRARLEENVEATNIELSNTLLAKISELFPPSVAAGDRYADMGHIDRST